jgi:hypothetical protein
MNERGPWRRSSHRGKLGGPTLLLLYGEHKELLFCDTFTFDELDEMDFIISLPENSGPGVYEQDAFAPCPDT